MGYPAYAISTNVITIKGICAKGRSILFNHFLDMRTTVNCPFHVEKTGLFLHEMDKLTFVLISIK